MNQQLRLSVLQNATVYPCINNPEQPDQIIGGVATDTGYIHTDSLLSRNWGEVVNPALPKYYKNTPINKLKKRCVFGGYVFLHFGHFLLESLSRVWALDPGECDTIIWCHPQKGVGFTELQLKILSILDLDKCNHVFSNEILLVEELILPEAGYRIQNYFNQQHMKKLGKLPPSPIITGKKIWLSRAKQLDKGGWVNEKSIEDILEAKGWIIYTPEDHSVADQIADISSSERIAGSEGSAFHSIILCSALESRIDIFSRGYDFNDNYATIGVAKKLRQYLHVSPVNSTSTKLASVRLELTQPEYIIDCLSKDENTLVTNKPIPLPSYLVKSRRENMNELRAKSVIPVISIDKISVSNTLDELGIANNTDKASLCKNQKNESKGGHNYLHSYDLLLSKYRNKPIKLMELGVGPDWNKGASLRMWRDYFTTAEILGIDNRESCRSEAEDRISIKIGDLGDISFLRTLQNTGASIIIDDASHQWNHQILALCELYPSLPEGGIYVVEDIATSFAPMDEQYGEVGEPSAYDFLQGIADKVTSRFKYNECNNVYTEYQRYIAKNTVSITFLHGSCILIKK